MALIGGVMQDISDLELLSSRCLKLVETWDPNADVPQGDVYVQQAQDRPKGRTYVVLACLVIVWALTFAINGMFDLLHVPSLKFGLFGTAVVVTLLLVAYVTVEWKLWAMHPIYSSMELGSMYAGQQGIPWLLIKGSGPDTVEYRKEDFSTPEKSRLHYLFFPKTVKLRLPKGAIVYVKPDDYTRLDQIRTVHKGMQTRSLLANAELPDLLRETNRGLRAVYGVQLKILAVNEEILKALKTQASYIAEQRRSNYYPPSERTAYTSEESPRIEEGDGAGSDTPDE